MVELVLNGRKHKGVALIDDADADVASKHKWHVGLSHGKPMYVKTCRGLLLHRLLLGLDRIRDAHIHVDHINGDGFDNRRHNLRICTLAENNRNVLRTDGLSCYHGVGWSHISKKWTAHITHNKKTHYLGMFESEDVAAIAYNQAARYLHGEFARVNTVPGDDGKAIKPMSLRHKRKYELLYERYLKLQQLFESNAELIPLEYRTKN